MRQDDDCSHLYQSPTLCLPLTSTGAIIKILKSTVLIPSTWMPFKGTGHLWYLPETSILIGVDQHCARHRHPVKLLAQFVIKVERDNTNNTPLLHKFVCFQMLKRASGLKSFNISVRYYLFLKKTMLLERKPFLTKLYTINTLPACTKYVLIITIILCPVH